MTTQTRVENFKICSKCGQKKSLEGFALHSTGKYGRSGQCKACKALYTRQYYDKNRERIITRTLAYRARNYERLKQASYVYRKANLESVKARASINNAINSGKLARKDCEDCGASKENRVEFHHTEGYSKDKWFTGMWLCAVCHGLRHKRARVLA